MATINPPPAAIKMLKQAYVWQGGYFVGSYVPTWGYFYSAVPNVTTNPAMPMYRLCWIQTTLYVGDVYAYVTYKVAPFPMNTVYSDPLNVSESGTAPPFDGSSYVYVGVR